LGFQTRKHGTLDEGVATALMLPVVVNATGVVVVKIMHSKCAPSSGGVTVAIAVVPEIKLRNVCGATVAADAIVGGFGIIAPATVPNCAAIRSLLGNVVSPY